jgi:hypothetical protein
MDYSTGLGDRGLVIFGTHMEEDRFEDEIATMRQADVSGGGVWTPLDEWGLDGVGFLATGTILAHDAYSDQPDLGHKRRSSKHSCRFHPLLLQDYARKSRCRRAICVRAPSFQIPNQYLSQLTGEAQDKLMQLIWTF